MRLEFAVQRLTVLCCLSFLIGIAVTPAVLRSFAEGPFPGFTGGFDEPTCQQCHVGHELNDASGKLTLTGAPSAFEPGASYALTVTLARKGMERGGFQLSARVASGAAKGGDAGTLTPSGAELQLVKSADGKVTYLQHSPTGTRGAIAGTITWKFGWIAPKTRVPVRFDVAANASNNDESPMDDLIYTALVTSKPK